MKHFNLIGFLSLALIVSIANCKLTPIEVAEVRESHSEAFDSFTMLLAKANARSSDQVKEFQRAISRPRTKVEKATIRTNRKAKIQLVHPTDGSIYYSN